MQEDGWVVCRVFKKKNLFKVSNHEGGGSSVNSDQNLNNNSSSASIAMAARTFMHRDSQYQLRLPQSYGGASQPAFELNKSDLALHYMPAAAPSSHYPHHLFQPQISAITHKPLGGGYEFPALSLPPDAPLMVKQLMANPESGQAGDGMNESWAVLDRLVTSHLGNEDENENENGSSSVGQINQLPLRGEMDFWGYTK